MKRTKARPGADGEVPPVDIAIPAPGYQNHLAADRRHRLIRPLAGPRTRAAAPNG